MQPGLMFIGTVREPERRVLKRLLTAARKKGYERFVEPACGAFSMSRIALESGFKAENIDASDVSFFSSVFGRAITGQPLEPLEIKSKYFEKYDLSKPEVVLWAQTVLRNTMSATSYYQESVINDFYARAEHHQQRIADYIKRYREELGKMKFSERDFFDHIREYENDDRAVIILALPTYTGGYEKFFDNGGRISWKEPEYDIFNPEEDYKKVVEYCRKIKPLVIMYEETATGQYSENPFFVRHGTRMGVNTYLTTNRIEEVLALTGEKNGTRENEATIQGLKYDYLGESDEITENSKVEVVSISSQNAAYYRLLLTHNFTGGASGGANYAVLIDGKLSGVFGFNDMLLALGKDVDGEFGQWLTYSMCIPYKKLRTLRLNTMLAMSRGVYMRNLGDLERTKATVMFTTMICKYPESKQMRGLMKMYKKEGSGSEGYRLSYKCGLTDDTIEEVFRKWYRKEIQYLKSRG